MLLSQRILMLLTAPHSPNLVHRSSSLRSSKVPEIITDFTGPPSPLPPLSPFPPFSPFGGRSTLPRIPMVTPPIFSPSNLTALAADSSSSKSTKPMFLSYRILMLLTVPHSPNLVHNSSSLRSSKVPERKRLLNGPLAPLPFPLALPPPPPVSASCTRSHLPSYSSSFLPTALSAAGFSVNSTKQIPLKDSSSNFSMERRSMAPQSLKRARISSSVAV
mmetsp:Transcript_15039/g.33480  ORF Transcript_15039/g.33480 Transcript_15039/m.33480 type:complete len:218 (-) Transcript_15039:237-890(-)